MVINNEEQLLQLKNKFEQNSVLKYTYEIEKENRLAFLDVNIQNNHNKFETSVFTKATNSSDCLNFKSDCPDRFKMNVISTFLQRAYNISSSWSNFTQELTRIKQLLINNNFSNAVVDEAFNIFINRKFSPPTAKINCTHAVYYENQFHKNYRTDEKILKHIFKTYIIPINSNKVNLNIYYRNRKVSNFLMKNNIAASTSDLQQSNVLYEIKCPVGACNALNVSYLGQTTNQLTRRITEHIANGAVKDHYNKIHNKTVTRSDIINNIRIIKTINDNNRLTIYEALSIIKYKPNINLQKDHFLRQLKLFCSPGLNERFIPS